MMYCLFFKKKKLKVVSSDSAELFLLRLNKNRTGSERINKVGVSESFGDALCHGAWHRMKQSI